MTGAHPSSSRTIREKEREVVEAWTGLKSQVSDIHHTQHTPHFLPPFLQSEARKTKLVDSYEFQRYLVHYRDLIAWLNSIQALVSADKLANDVGGAERLLERHQQLQVEIEARESNFNSFEASAGQQLAARHFASTEIQQKLESVQKERALLKKFASFLFFSFARFIMILHAGRGWSGSRCWTSALICRCSTTRLRELRAGWTRERPSWPRRRWGTHWMLLRL